MALELEGTLRQKLGAQSGTSARGTWSKQEFIVEFPDGNFTSQACFTAWGQDKVAELDKYQVGDRVKVSLRFRGREMAHMAGGRKVLDSFAELLSDVAVVEKAPKLEGRSMTMFLSEKR